MITFLWFAVSLSTVYMLTQAHIPVYTCSANSKYYVFLDTISDVRDTISDVRDTITRYGRCGESGTLIHLCKHASSVHRRCLFVHCPYAH